MVDGPWTEGDDPVRAIALSQFFGPANARLDDPFEAAAAHGAQIVKRLLDSAPWGGEGYQTFYNVNFPPCPAAEVRGARSVRQGLRPTCRFGVEAQIAPNGRRFLWARGGKQDEPTGAGTDVQANIDGWISVTPMRADLTAHDLIDPLEQALG